MKSMRTILAAFCAGGFLTASGNAKPIPAKPLSPLNTINKRLKRGINAVIRATPPHRAFLPIKAMARRPGLAGNLRTVGARSAVLIGYEFELIFFSGPSAVYYLRTFVHPGPKGPAFLSVSGRRLTAAGGRYVRGRSPKAHTGTAAPFGRAATALLKVLRSSSCTRLPVVNPAPLRRKVTSKRIAARLLGDVKKTRRGIRRACLELASIRSDRVELRIDDVVFGAVNARGKIFGMIGGELRFRRNVLHVELGGFRPFR
jgi:hypothetical protein